TGLATDAASFSHSGNLFKTPDGGFRLGWYGGVKGLGRSLHPRLRAGLTARLGTTEASAGASIQTNADPDEERWALEFALKHVFVDQLKEIGGGWEVYFQAASRHVLSAERDWHGREHNGTF